MLSSVITMISFFLLCACCHRSRICCHLIVWLCVAWLFLMLRMFGRDHCQYIDKMRIGLLLGSLTSIHTVDVISSLRLLLLVYIMSSLIKIMLHDWLVVDDFFVCLMLCGCG